MQLALSVCGLSSHRAFQVVAAFRAEHAALAERWKARAPLAALYESGALDFSVWGGEGHDAPGFDGTARRRRRNSRPVTAAFFQQQKMRVERAC